MVCDFHDSEYSIRDFSEKEMRSVIVNVMNPKHNSTDYRAEQIAGIIFNYFNNKKETALTQKEKDLKIFIYSEPVMKTFKGRRGCTIVKQNNHLDVCPE